MGPTFVCTEAQTDKNLIVSGKLKKPALGGEKAKMAPTYLVSGRSVRDQIMALMHPMTSSSGGTGPDVGQIPFRTYNGEVPMSE